MPSVVAFGNVLLDYVSVVKDEFLKRHGIKKDTARELPVAALKIIYEDLRKDMNGTFVSGGCAQNTLRILDWLKNETVMFGAIGNDANAYILRHTLENLKMNLRYAIIKNKPTGLALSLVTGHERSLVCNIGASTGFELQHLLQEENLLLINNSTLIYMESFFLPERKQVSERILKIAKNRDITFAFNLCAPYMVEKFGNEMQVFINGCNILFGNYHEYVKYANFLKLTDLSELIIKLCTERENKIVIMTNGPKEITFGYGAVLNTYKVPELDLDEVKDTTGAGDAFVAGFLHCYLKGYTVEGCIEFGTYIAHLIIKEFGCTPPQTEPEKVLPCRFQLKISDETTNQK